MSQTRVEGTIRKALSGFYYVQTEQTLVTCRARGKFRYQKVTPLVGDRVAIALQPDGSGSLVEILPRRNAFQRPAVANLDQLVIIYRAAGIPALPVSAVTGLGIDQLRGLLAGKISAFTGNSGVGKSSLLNALDPAFGLATGEISEKLGRGRHTTRHVELFPLAGGLIADTPGFSAFDQEKGEDPVEQEALARSFREFRPYLGQCRFVGCAHVKEQGCAVLAARDAGKIVPSRHESYVRLYELARENKPWGKN